MVLWRWAQALSVLRGCMRKPTATVPPCCVSESNAERRQGGTSCLRMYRHTRCPPCLLSCAISILSDPSGDAQTSSLPTHTLYHSSHTRRRANTAKSFLAIFYPRVRPVRVCVCVREVGRLSSDGRRALGRRHTANIVHRTHANEGGSDPPRRYGTCSPPRGEQEMISKREREPSSSFEGSEEDQRERRRTFLLLS